MTPGDIGTVIATTIAVLILLLTVLPTKLKELLELIRKEFHIKEEEKAAVKTETKAVAAEETKGALEVFYQRYITSLEKQVGEMEQKLTAVLEKQAATDRTNRGLRRRMAALKNGAEKRAETYNARIQTLEWTVSSQATEITQLSNSNREETRRADTAERSLTAVTLELGETKEKLRLSSINADAQDRRIQSLEQQVGTFRGIVERLNLQEAFAPAIKADAVT